MGSNQRVVFIFLLIMGIALTLYIGIQLIKYYKETKEYTEGTSSPSIACTGYIYAVSRMGYDAEELKFTIRNEKYSDYEIRKITVQTNTTQTYNVSTLILQGMEKEIRVRIENLQDTFLIYPENCMIYAKKCAKKEMLCS